MICYNKTNASLLTKGTIEVIVYEKLNKELSQKYIDKKNHINNVFD